MKKVVVGIAGMPGAGKATFNEMARRNGYAMVVMGDEIREETKRRGLEPTPENIGKIMLQLRKEEGQAVVGKKMHPQNRESKRKHCFCRWHPKSPRSKRIQEPSSKLHPHRYPFLT